MDTAAAATPLSRPAEPPLRRVGLFGGTFDPVHWGHIWVAQAAMEEAALDRLYWIPAAQSPLKHSVPNAPDALRLRMLRLALAGQTRMRVDPSELNRGGKSYSIETIREYRKQFPDAEIFYLIGADNAGSLKEWREAPALAESAVFLVVPRPGMPARAEKAAAEEGFCLRGLEGALCGISSSEIRARVNSGRFMDSLVPPPVLEVIRGNRLYL